MYLPSLYLTSLRFDSLERSEGFIFFGSNFTLQCGQQEKETHLKHQEDALRAREVALKIVESAAPKPGNASIRMCNESETCIASHTYLSDYRLVHSSFTTVITNKVH
jgi:hypothetical protein